MRAAPVLHTHTSAGAVALGLAITPGDVDDADRLVHDSYVECGYRDGAPPRRRRVPPSTTVFVARAADAVIGTLSLVRDSAKGLPADALYAGELRALRACGRRLAEVSALAVAPAWRSAALSLIRPLVQLVGVYARDLARLDELCIAVHPRHAAFYERRLTFTRFGGEKAYAAVKGAPAVGLRLDLRRPPAAGALTGSLFVDSEVARVRAALDRDLRRRAAAAGPLMQLLQFPPAAPRVARPAPAEVC